MSNASRCVAIAPTVTLKRTVSDVGERALIARITARLTQPPWVVLGPGDDAAVIKPERGTFDVITTDAQVEGVHFDCRFVPPEAIGYRALAVNLSDLAAMGAQPRAALLSLALPDALEESAFDDMIDGLLALASRYRVAVVGGNITRSSGPIVIDITAIGAVGPRKFLRRSDATVGDDVYVTGSIGDAFVGLRSLQARSSAGASESRSQDHADACEGRYLRPDPRVRAGVLLGRNRAASACIDLSDGLADGLRRIAEASGVGIAVDASLLPISDEVRRWHQTHDRDPVTAAVAGGDDYELLFTSRPAQHGRLASVRRQIGGLAVTKIGTVTKDRALIMRTVEGDQQLPEGFEHFRCEG